MLPELQVTTDYRAGPSNIEEFGVRLEGCFSPKLASGKNRIGSHERFAGVSRDCLARLIAQSDNLLQMVRISARSHALRINGG